MTVRSGRSNCHQTDGQRLGPLIDLKLKPNKWQSRGGFFVHLRSRPRFRNLFWSQAGRDQGLDFSNRSSGTFSSLKIVPEKSPRYLGPWSRPQMYKKSPCAHRIECFTGWDFRAAPSKDLRRCQAIGCMTVQVCEKAFCR